MFRLKECYLKPHVVEFLLILILLLFQVSGQTGNYVSHSQSGRSVIVKCSSASIRITPYGDYIVRVQFAGNNEEFYPDNRYEMVESHNWEGKLDVLDETSSLTLSTPPADGIKILIAKSPLCLSFYNNKTAAKPVLEEKEGVTWSSTIVAESFVATNDEHFAGLGHEAYGRIPKLDRKGTSLKVRSGSEGACVVPFYLSSRGYGVFLNTTFTHTITLCKNGVYSLEIDGEGYGGQMDYFFISGPTLTNVIDRYTRLTGRPRLPQRSIFGLHLSDKSDPTNNGEQWWKSAITNHRNAGFAFDHQVNDNAWRASNEATSGQNNSWFEFRKDRFPDPAEYKRWCDANGVTVTLDLNRPGIPLNPSWKTSLSIPGTKDCPDFTNEAARKWIWELFWTKALNPSLGYPGDAIWLDEFDYPDHPHSTTLYSGKKWAEEAINYHLNLLKACVHEGWDKAIGEAKRPYFWSRGITAGAQRWGQYWSGDIDGNWNDMKYQVKAMQSAGICGFPYFNHDAGGHLNLTNNGDNSYRQWDMGFGSFTPIWKPHGPSHKHWPLQRNTTCQNTAKTYITLRYQMMPYIYTYAYIAHATGIPMARPMFLDDPENATAWQREMQYYWGKELLVAPNCSDGNNTVEVWLPGGTWYDFWNDTKYNGDRIISYSAATGVVPVFAKAGAIIPTAPFAKSTFFIPKDTLIIHVYTGADGKFQLYEDDGVTEKFRTKSEFRTTDVTFTQNNLCVTIGAGVGSFNGASTRRSYQIIYHGLQSAAALYYDTTALQVYSSLSNIPADKNGTVWDAAKKVQTVRIASLPVNRSFTVAGVPTNISIRDNMKRINNTLWIVGDKLLFEYPSYGEYDISIYQPDGSKIKSFKKTICSKEPVQSFSVGSLNLSKGIYIIKIKTTECPAVYPMLLLR